MFAFLAVALGAFGAHFLKSRIEAADLETFKTAASYQLVHGLALFAAARFAAAKLQITSCMLFTIGIVVFCGSVYGIALGAPRWLGAVAPVGGMALMAGWVSLAVAHWPMADKEQSMG